MIHPLLIPLICAAFAITSIAPHPVSTVSHVASPELLVGVPHLAAGPTPSSLTCDNLHECRTLSSIVQSSLLTILACAWFAVHHNIAAPKKERPDEPRRKFFTKAVHYLKDKLVEHRPAALVFIVTLLAPEWMLGNALLQALTAWRLAKKLEAARVEAKTTREEAKDAREKAEDARASLKDEVREVPMSSFEAVEAAELVNKVDARTFSFLDTSSILHSHVQIRLEDGTRISCYDGRIPVLF